MVDWNRRPDAVKNGLELEGEGLGLEKKGEWILHGQNDLDEKKNQLKKNQLLKKNE